MKKIITFLLFCCITAAAIAQDGNTASPAPPTHSRNRSTAIWIGLGVVFFVMVVAANKRKKRDR